MPLRFLLVVAGLLPALAAPAVSLLPAPFAREAARLYRVALDKNASLAALQARWLAQSAAASRAGAWSEPVLKVSRIDQPANLFRSTGMMTGAGTTLSLMQMFMFPGKLSGMADAERAMAASRGREREMAARMVRKMVVDNLARVAVSRAQLALLAEKKAMFDALANVVQAKNATGGAMQMELVQVVVDRERVADAVYAQEAELAKARADLGALLGDDAALPAGGTNTGAAYSAALPADTPALDGPALDSVLARYHEFPKLAMARAMVDAARAELSVARLSWFPDLSVGAMLMPGNAARPEVMVGLELSVPLPLWFWQRQVPEVRGKGLKLAAAQYELVQAERDYRAAAGGAHADLTRAAAQYRLYGEKLVPQAELAYRSVQQAYVSGMADYQALSGALAMLYMVKADRLMRLLDWVMAVGALDALTGEGV